MKKVLALFTAVLMTTAFFVSCSDGGSSGDNREPWVSGEEPEDPEGVEVPENALRNWTYDDHVKGKTYVIAGYQDLKKLVEVVNLGDGAESEGCSFAGCTIELISDITINESVLDGDFEEPAEYAPGKSASGYVNLDSIGRLHNSKDADATENEGLAEKCPFKGTFDGKGHTISGYYSYQGHEGLGFFGYVDGATIKNLILLDSNIVNMNTWAGELGNYGYDGSDDDRVGGLVGLAAGNPSTIENCVFVGVVGSNATITRPLQLTPGASQIAEGKTENPAAGCEYYGALIGRNDVENTAITNCLVYAKVYGKGDEFLVGKLKAAVVQNSVVAETLSAETYNETTVQDKIEEIKVLASNVTPPVTTYAVTVNAGANGTAEADKETAAEGETVTLTITPASTDYELDAVTVNGAAITGTTFTMPAEAVTVEVTFKAVQSGEPDPAP